MNTITKTETSSEPHALGLSQRCTCGWRIPNCAAHALNELIAVIRLESVSRQVSLGHCAHGGVQSVDTSRRSEVLSASVTRTSRGHRRLIEPTTVRLPAIGTDIRTCAAC